MRRIILVLFSSFAVFFSFQNEAKAQRFSIGTNGIDWFSLGAMNIEAGMAVAQKWSLHVGAELNP